MKVTTMQFERKVRGSLERRGGKLSHRRRKGVKKEDEKKAKEEETMVRARQWKGLTNGLGRMKPGERG